MSLSTLARVYRDRLRLAALPFACAIAIGAVLRVVLYIRFHAGPPRPATLIVAVAAGLFNDLLIWMVLLAPVLLLLALLRLRVLEYRAVRFALLGAFGGVAFFEACTEYFFFDEFNSRYNHVALDYLLRPHEVFGNIRDSYDVGLYAGWSLLLGIVVGFAALLWTRRVQLQRLPAAARWRAVACVAAATALALGALEALPAEISRDRVVSEIAQNGIGRLVHAFRTGHLDYELYYRTLPPDVARQRAAGVVALPERSDAPALPAAASSATPGKPWDVVVIVEESLGSEFVSNRHHGKHPITPGFQRWTREGLYFANLTATGNRTVRGLEGTLSSFLPLPGDAILWQLKTGVPTLGEVFRRAGYRTVFLYGGWGTFDSMKPFYPDNGYEEFIERGDFPREAFRTIWGVADEYVFDRLLERQREAQRRGERLFATALTVSNHKPYAVPERGTAWPARRRDRACAVAYADWALARYLDASRDAGLLDHTLVLVVGDHGPRVYGSESVPAESYRVPGLMLVPDSAWRGRRIERVCSQIDLAPTLLSLMDLPTSAPFLGADVSRLPADGGRAFLLHNRDVAMLTDTALVTLGLQHEERCYRRSGRESDDFEEAACAADPDLQRLQDDATAAFQVAYDLVRDGEFAVPPAAPGPRVAGRDGIAARPERQVTGATAGQGQAVPERSAPSLSWPSVPAAGQAPRARTR
ncbi:MAG: LTA synthase family protein [Acidobacteria bacterium]|nr:LTA synthase family protein [Acidobacteriota bacterium]